MQIIEGIHYSTGEPVSISVHDGIITGIRSVTVDCEKDIGRLLVAPGLVDLQINGYNGFDMNEFPIDSGRVHRIVREVWKEGVTTFFPTVTTNSEERIVEAMTVIARACDEDALTDATIAGIHVEGPFISPEDGPRGAHKKEFVRTPDWDAFERWQEAAGGRIRIITLSPEWPGSPDFIERCVRNGVTVAIGHTAAQPEQIRDAAGAGARLSTHFGNGAHLMLPRHPNYLWEQLAQDSLWVSLIADGFHLPEAFLKVALMVKKEQAILVSDAVHLSGMPPGEYISHKRIKVVKTPEGRLYLADQPNLLAGSCQMLPWGIGHLVRTKLCRLAEAWEMASIRPSALMSLPTSGGLAVRCPADLVLFSAEEGQIRIHQTYKRGIRCDSIEAQNDMF